MCSTEITHPLMILLKAVLIPIAVVSELKVISYDLFEFVIVTINWKNVPDEETHMLWICGVTKETPLKWEFWYPPSCNVFIMTMQDYNNYPQFYDDLNPRGYGRSGR